MATKKSSPVIAADESAPPPTPEVRKPAVNRTSKSAITGGIAAKDLEVLAQPIDDRMDALLKDHQDMGARPK